MLNESSVACWGRLFTTGAGSGLPCLVWDCFHSVLELILDCFWLGVLPWVGCRAVSWATSFFGRPEAGIMFSMFTKHHLQHDKCTLYSWSRPLGHLQHVWPKAHVCRLLVPSDHYRTPYTPQKYRPCCLLKEKKTNNKMTIENNASQDIYANAQGDAETAINHHWS